MCPALNSQLPSPRNLHMQVAPLQRRVHGSSCKAAPAAVLLQLAAFGMVLKHQKIIAPGKVQPQWPVLAAEPEEGLPLGDSSHRGFSSPPMGTFTNMKHSWGAPSHISFHPVSPRVKTPVRRLVRVNTSICIPLARATGNSLALKE